MIVVPTPELDSPAARALRMEGLGCREYLCRTDTDYGTCVSDLWANGIPFVICEHDVIPWPGALEGLLVCPEPWCLHRYPIGVGNIAQAFGCAKYTPAGDPDPEWATSPWWLLDGYVIPVLNRLYSSPHVHDPPVAHIRAEIP